MSYSNVIGTLRAGWVPVPVFWRGLGAVVLGIVLAQWTWILFAPHPTIVAATPHRGIAEETAHIFGQVISGASVATTMALPNVQLVGVFAGSVGQPGFAILKLDDKRQIGVAVGEEVAPGTTLREVHPDFVLLERAGVQQQVNMDQKASNISVASAVPVVNRKNGMASVIRR
ncbi:MAG: type II secretion system protein N [Gallionellaceae bacterium]|nr:type II secretion system protein N [Gallionellaceae bacterium]